MVKILHIVGDSISLQYRPYLKQMLEGRFQLLGGEGIEEAMQNLDVPIGGNAGDSQRALSILKTLEGGGLLKQIQIMVLNCGLHDIKSTAGNPDLQVPLADYERNVRDMLQLLRNSGVEPIWVRTTPVEDERHNSRSRDFKRSNVDVLRYNQAADAVVRDMGVHSIDLYGYVDSLIHAGQEVFCDHVHYTDNVRALQAAFIAGHLYALA